MIEKANKDGVKVGMQWIGSSENEEFIGIPITAEDVKKSKEDEDYMDKRVMKVLEEIHSADPSKKGKYKTATEMGLKVIRNITNEMMAVPLNPKDDKNPHRAKLDQAYKEFNNYFYIKDLTMFNPENIYQTGKKLYEWFEKYKEIKVEEAVEEGIQKVIKNN
jgi:hypothetical protein